MGSTNEHMAELTRALTEALSPVMDVMNDGASLMML